MALVRKLALTSLEDDITEEDLRRVLPEAAPVGHSKSLSLLLDQPLREARETFEKLYFEALLSQDGQNMSRVAEKTGLERTHLYRKLKQLGIQSGKKGVDSAEA